MAHSGHEYAASGSSAPAMSFQGFSAFPGSMMEVTGPHEMQGLVQPSNSQHDNGLGMLQQLAQGPEQALWLQTELAKRPIQPGQSPLHWILWREKCEEGWDQFQAWQLALEDERRMTAQEGQANQIAAQQPQSYHHHPQQQQQQQPSYAATTINPAQLQQFQGKRKSSHLLIGLRSRTSCPSNVLSCMCSHSCIISV
ncbi:hypothetical protein BD324DRAFT_639489 [Kockovaella imperatae]|uniref:Uncharacterized protein n=1 Tax=Kockovaella imperatae TaxID=4999 RepID=A0A1Y1U6D8_9TREE|nr:hypothetical protein BD324DRAFT_639489 [Kockovaella imperatae]ORX33601.1 hypothetical protein BD324DRAFT_639489 [Kockovaella imperatae]